MVSDWKDWKLSDVVYGIVAPGIVALLIVGVSASSGSFISGLKYPLADAIIIAAVPLLLGLIWNQWAGGVAGFLMGSVYTLWYSDQLYASTGRGDIILLGNLVSAMLIGYVAGALNKHSTSYLRMLISGIVAGTMGTLIIFLVSYLSPLHYATSATFFLTFLSRTLCAFVVPVIAKVFMRYGMSINKKQNL